MSRVPIQPLVRVCTSIGSDRFAPDSLLEEDGFEPSVPLGSNTSVSTGFAGWRGGRSLFRKAPRLRGDRQFESVFLRQGVCLTSAFHGCRRKGPVFAGSVSQAGDQRTGRGG